MLFTRCPECATTFRVTDETLKKARGQVRCGRCASVFNAYAELHDPTAKTFEAEPPPPQPAVERPPTSPTTPIAPAATPTPTPSTVPPSTAVSTPPPSKPVEPDPTALSIGAASIADVVAEAKLAAAEQQADDGHAEVDPGPISATEVDRVLDATTSPPLPQALFEWRSVGGAGERQTQSRGWAVAAVVALLAFGAQVTHHFRSAIAGHPTFGPWVAQVYGALGAEITPNYDVHQYEIIDWVATAEPNSRGLGSLKITARIQNHGPLRQPYPAVQLRLKDRWEAAVGSRMFTPAEYLPSDAPRGRLMSPGETTRAEIEVVDPGPDAYGFELDVCIEVEASLVTCGTDEVFL
jgi:predicted Zn finger-like uncharacterized protein